MTRGPQAKTATPFLPDRELNLFTDLYRADHDAGLPRWRHDATAAFSRLVRHLPAGHNGWPSRADVTLA